MPVLDTHGSVDWTSFRTKIWSELQLSNPNSAAWGEGTFTEQRQIGGGRFRRSRVRPALPGRTSLSYCLYHLTLLLRASKTYEGPSDVAAKMMRIDRSWHRRHISTAIPHATTLHRRRHNNHAHDIPSF